MKFLSDENITRKTTNLFKNQGYDIETVQSLGIRGIKNSKLLDKIISSDRILITFDADFKALLKDNIEFPGIIFIDVNPNIDAIVLPAIRIVMPKLSSIALQNRILIVDEQGKFTVL